MGRAADCRWVAAQLGPAVLARDEAFDPRVMRLAHGARCGAASVRTGAGPLIAAWVVSPPRRLVDLV
jgi:hypothetical protein